LTTIPITMDIAFASPEFPCWLCAEPSIAGIKGQEGAVLRKLLRKQVPMPSPWH